MEGGAVVGFEAVGGGRVGDACLCGDGVTFVRRMDVKIALACSLHKVSYG